MIRRFFKDGFYYSLSSILGKGLSIFLVPLYTRIFSPKDYGIIDMLTIFSTLINLTIALEITQGIGLFLANSENERDKILYSSTAFWFTITSNGIFFLLAFLFISFKINYDGKGKREITP
jgi:O-antigen/teichoic acid export membrane protein